MSSLVMNGIDDTLVIRGGKTILGDVYVTDTATLLKANDVDLRELESIYLKVYGNQDIPGNFFIDTIEADKYYFLSSIFCVIAFQLVQSGLS